MPRSLARAESADLQMATSNPPSAVRRSKRVTHQRTRSVHFSTEPVARDVQREMELQLQRWVQPALELLFPFGPSARGAASVRLCTRVKEEKKVVVKTVGITLPPNRDTAMASVRSGGYGFSSTDLSSDLSGNLLYPSSERDASWSQAQLLPDASIALFDQVGQRVPQVAGVVDVFTLASMLRNTERPAQSPSCNLDDDDTNLKELVRMPKVSAQEMELRGWAMANAATAAKTPSTTTAVKRDNSASSMTGSARGVPTPPHPTVFLYARDYVESVDSLDVLLQDRWGRDRLPISVTPRWAHCGPVSNDERAGAGKPEDLQRLEDHVTRWLSGRAKVEKRKRRLMDERTATETSQRGAAFAAPVSEDRQRLTEHDAADIVWAVASALEALHRTGHAHGNVKPNNVLVELWNAEADAGACRKVCLTDHLLPLVPDALLEPGAVLSLPGWRSRETRGYVCMKPHDASVLPHMFGGGPAGTPFSDPASYTISGNWLATESEEGGHAVTLEGGVDGLLDMAYEAVLLQHLLAPENVLLVLDESETPAAAATATTAGATYRVWVNVHATTPATDVYAMGVLLWEMLVGRLPPLPQYRCVVRGGVATTASMANKAVSADHTHALPPLNVEVMLRSVMAHFEARAKRDAKQTKRLQEVPVFLRSETARAHLPLVLALARTENTRLVTMDLLIRLLHTDPKHRLTVAELRQHAFFRTFGSRRHELRRQHEAAQRAAGLSARHSMRAADGRALMPRQMGALTGVVEDARQALERCRSEVSATSLRGHRRPTAATVGGHTSAPSAARSFTSGHASPPPTRSQSTLSFSPPSVAECSAVRGGAGPQRTQGKPEDSCFLGPASPSLTRRSSVASNNSSSSRPSCPSPVAATARDDSAALALAAAERSPSLRLRTPSLPPMSSDGPESTSLGLARTKTFRGARRWTAMPRADTVMLSPTREDSPPRRASNLSDVVVRTQMGIFSPTVPSDGTRVRCLQGRPEQGDGASSPLTPKASWMRETVATPLLSRPSRRLAPLAAEPPAADGDKAMGKHPLGPRRPAVRVRPSASLS